MVFLSDLDLMKDIKESDQDLSFFNPLAQPISRWYEFHKRIRLFPWWLRYNLGSGREVKLKNRIIELGMEFGIPSPWMNKIIRHAIAEFSKKGLGFDYYGYHNIYHELEATYFTLLAAKKHYSDKNFNFIDIKYLFLAALFHDFDPLKRFDKPNEEEVEWFIRKDNKIRDFIKEGELNIEILIALIYRTAYPFRDSIAIHAIERMNQLFSKAGISKDDKKTRKHYHDLGWFLSVSERVAGYALGSFDRAMELARLNAHGLGWHPSLINKESVKYFSLLKGEKEMLDKVLYGVSKNYQQNFLENIAKFKEGWTKEVEIKTLLRNNEISLVPFIESDNKKIDVNTLNRIIEIKDGLDISPLASNKKKFVKSITDSNCILITLRVKEKDNKVVGFAKGGELEQYRLRRGTYDENLGENNTTFIEPIYIQSGYWGERGGHLLRLQFLNEAKKRGYKFVTGYVHRDVLTRRIEKGEPIKIVQKYDPDKLDYYRTHLDIFNYNLFI